LVVNGVYLFDKLVNPFYLFIVSLLIPVYYLKLLRSDKKNNSSTYANLFRTVGLLIGFFSILICVPQLHKIFYQCSDPGKGSDIIPQLTTLYNRFSKGIFPYYPLEQLPWHPFPVYMPLHWLPLWIAYTLHFDIRWIGVFFLAISCAIYGCSTNTRTPLLKYIVVALLPSVALWGFIEFNGWTLGVTFEIIIAAYYLVLAAGLSSSNIIITTLGIIFCLLSRYTVIFWLPFFLILLWYNASLRQNIIVWSCIAASIVCFYVIPFYLKDPSILSKSIAYHNQCYIDQWNGLGNPAQSEAFNDGLNFSYFTRAAFKGSIAQRVFYARVIQAVLMIFLNVLGLLMYKKWKAKIHYYEISLILLYLIIFVFFISSPLTYKYYYLDFLVISAVICGKIIVY